jgi:hypothetical protein
MTVDTNNTVQALPEGGWVLSPSTFLVPTSPFPASDLDRQIHGEVQQVITLIYAMLACGMDMYTIKLRVLGTE